MGPRSGYPGPGDIKLGPGLYWVRGALGRLEPDVASALLFAYQRALRYAGGLRFPPIMITQGASVQATPGEAHDGGGAVDLRVRHMYPFDTPVLIRALRESGFAVYHLDGPSYTPHIHAIYVHSTKLNAAAIRQAARAPHKPPGRA